MKPSKLSLIRRASRVDLSAYRWRDSLDLWLRLNYGMPSPEARALRKWTVDSYLGFDFVRTQLKPAPLKPKPYSFAAEPLLVASGRPIRKANAGLTFAKLKRAQRLLDRTVPRLDPLFVPALANLLHVPPSATTLAPRRSPIARIEPSW